VFARATERKNKKVPRHHQPAVKPAGPCLVQIASRAIVHCVHEKFLRAFFKSQSKKTKKFRLSRAGGA
jgi:hypothetical protein